MVFIVNDCRNDYNYEQFVMEYIQIKKGCRFNLTRILNMIAFHSNWFVVEFSGVIEDVVCVSMIPRQHQRAD